jgi:hypothetical protein
MGKPVPVLDAAELILVSLVPNEAQVRCATEALGLPEGSLVLGDGTPLVFIFIGDFKIPVNRQILILQSGPHDFTFVLPNKMFLQVILPPSECSMDELDVMFSYGNLKKKPGQAPPPATVSRVAEPVTDAVVGPPEQKRKISTRIAIGLGKVTKVAVAGIAKGAEIVSHGVAKGTDKIVQVTEPCKDAVKVSESTKAHVNRARMATKGIAVLSGTVATAMIGVTAVMGNFIGQRVANRVAKSDETGGNTDRLAAVREVGGAAIGCVGLVFSAATDAGRTILSSSCDGISKVVTHKLGDEAGDLAHNGLGVVTDVVDIQNNIKMAGVKGIVKATAQSSAVAMIGELERRDAAAAAAQSPSAPK